VLQERVFERVGCGETRRCNVRIVAATNRQLPEEVAKGRFRADLYYRLNVFPIAIPPLRQRPADLPLLVDDLNLRLGGRGFAPVVFSDAALAVLARHDWPGNVRELENLLERLAVSAGGATVGVAQLPFAPLRPVGAAPEPEEIVLAPRASAELKVELPADGLCLKGTLAALESDLIGQALERADGVVAKAARLLGVGRTTLLEKLRKRPDLEGRFAAGRLIEAAVN
jgi:sigma-54 specific flagellar transcriptional regulator A